MPGLQDPDIGVPGPWEQGVGGSVRRPPALGLGRDFPLGYPNASPAAVGHSG